MKKILKTMLIFLVLICLIFIYNPEANATDNIMQGAENFLNAGTKNILNSGAINITSNTLFNIFAIFGTVAVLIVGAILGIKFIMGSIEEKAKIKEMLTPYIISSIVIFGAFGIWSLLVDVLQNIF